MTEISLDGDEQWNTNYLSPNSISPNTSTAGRDIPVIAPWVNEPVITLPGSPPRQPSKGSFALLHKPSIPFVRQGSTSNAASKPRPSETSSISETISSGYTERNSIGDSRKSSSIIKRIKSSLKLTPKDDIIPPFLPSSSEFSLPQAYESFHPLPSPPPHSKRKEKKVKKREPISPGLPPPLPPKEPEFRLDTNLEDMGGIIDVNKISQDAVFGGAGGEASSPGSGFESNNHSSLSTDGEFHNGGNTSQSSPPQSVDIGSGSASLIFFNPFTPQSEALRPGQGKPPHRPKTVPPTSSYRPQSPPDVASHDANWQAPESWAVHNPDTSAIPPDYASSEEEEYGEKPAVKPSQPVHRHKTRRVTKYSVRIHRTDGTYHVVACPPGTTVLELTGVLNKRLNLDATREPHSLYVKERERERVLASTERPALLVRRRLEQAGYDPADGLHILGAEDIGFLIKFIYKSNLLGGAGEEVSSLDSYEYIDLTGRSLKTIPIVLHTHAQTIVTLNLSRNPMLEIPLDFIQSCAVLRELRLSNMAMKKVPQSVRHSASLRRLDISSNRIADLDDAGLDLIPGLANLIAQNNRIDRLPPYFGQISGLKFLNISNNKFQQFPSVITHMTGLLDLDLSFNNIAVLPPEIGNLHSLEKLIIIGNRVGKIPDECVGLVNLEILDCRRNHISDLSLVCKLPKLRVLQADHNAIQALDLAIGPSIEELNVSHNDITQLLVPFGPVGPGPYCLTSLDLSHAKLSSLDDLAFANLTSLTHLRLDHNKFRFIPHSLGNLTRLTFFSCFDNELSELPTSIGELQKLEILDVHNNGLTELPASMWQCGSLRLINVTSNLLRNWHDPPVEITENYGFLDERKGSIVTLGSTFSRTLLPPLALSLERLYLGENRLTSEVLHPLTLMRQLRILNLSFNDIQELPSSFLRHLTRLEELYLSGNKLTSIPTEDLERLKELTVLFLNGNKLQTLPVELRDLRKLTVLDVGSNMLKYNINNWEFDWNWNFNKKLKYLNLSGNKRLKIQSDPTSHRMSMAPSGTPQRRVLADFSELEKLRVLGLMDVTTVSNSVPEETDVRRVRTSLSEVNNMLYGIADTVGKAEHLYMLDLVKPQFRGRDNECIFAMFGPSHDIPASNRIPRYLCENFPKVFSQNLDKIDNTTGEGVPDALRRTFLQLNKNLNAHLTQCLNPTRKMSHASVTSVGTSFGQFDASLLRSGASGVVAYFHSRTLYVANAGDALAVISRQGSAQLVSCKHEPFDRGETARIRAAEGWVSPKAKVNEESEVSRSFGYYHLLPAVNARPDIQKWEVTEQDEFLILANRGLWDYVTYQTAVDIARSEAHDSMIAAQKLRDFAISYGADGNTVIMVVNLSGLFEDTRTIRPRQATSGSLPDVDLYEPYMPRNPKNRAQGNINDVTIARLGDEVPAPTGHVALVFTDIRNSTHLWEINSGMPTAMRLHNSLLRRQLRLCGGYEVKTEGDAFMCSFSSVLSALQWCVTVQLQLLHEAWPLEILECEDGKEIKDAEENLLARGLSVRMGIHCGKPVCEPDPITGRMDYFGPMPNRTARISGSAAGGQIMCSADVIREVKARVFDGDPDFEYDPTQSTMVETLRQMDLQIFEVGERKMKGLEVPEVISLVYPKVLAGRRLLKDNPSDSGPSGSKVQFSIDQMEHLAILCLRLEVLASDRVYLPSPEEKAPIGLTDVVAPEATEDADPAQSIVVRADPYKLIPHISPKATDLELMAILDSLSLRIENALKSLTLNSLADAERCLMSQVQAGMPVDTRLLMSLLSALQNLSPSSSL